MKKCTVEMIINVSHEIDEINFHGINKYEIIDNAKVCTKYNSKIFFPDTTPEEYIKKEFEKEAKIVSLAMSQDEINPVYGCPFLTIDWKSLYIEPIAATTDCNNEQEPFFCEHINLRHYLEMETIRAIEINKINEFVRYRQNYSFDIEIFYNGLMSNNAKSKFFNFFIIIEGLEGSDVYRKRFNNDFLFSEKEKTDIKTFLEPYEERKKKRLFEILDTTTRLPRAEKLYQHLQILNLVCVNTGIIGIDDIKGIIDQRNKLFHSSKKFNSHLLYAKLFPLVRELVTRQLLNENQAKSQNLDSMEFC